MHYYQFNIGDYASHTSRLSPMEDLAYRRMIDLYYLSEQPLNGCATDVAREIGLLDQIDSVKYVLSKFFIEEENTFTQKRIDSEIKKYKLNAKKKSKAGKASAKARKDKASSKSTGVEQVLNTCSTDDEQALNTTGTNEQQTNNQEPITNNQEPTIKDNTDQPPEVGNEQKSPKNEVFEIYKFWCDTMKKSTARTALSKKRQKVITDRLKQYSIDEIKTAIVNCSNTPHNMGKNSNGTLYNDIELICRNPEKLEQFRDNAPNRNSMQLNINHIASNFEKPEGWS